MSISLYQRYFDCLSVNEANLMGICDNRNIIVACTQQKYIGYPFSDIKIKCTKTDLDFDKTDKYILFSQQEIWNFFFEMWTCAKIQQEKQ